MTLQRVLKHLLIDVDINKAVTDVCDRIGMILGTHSRLLNPSNLLIRVGVCLSGGELDLDEFIMGAYLWRQNHIDIARMSGDSKGLTKEDKDGLKTPHVSLAVKLFKRNNERRFRLGEWIRSAHTRAPIQSYDHIRISNDRESRHPLQ